MHDLEVRAFHAPEFFVKKRDAFIGRGGYGPCGTIVGDNHAIALQRGENRGSLSERSCDVASLD